MLIKEVISFNDDMIILSMIKLKQLDGMEWPFSSGALESDRVNAYSSYHCHIINYLRNPFEKFGPTTCHVRYGAQTIGPIQGMEIIGRAVHICTVNRKHRSTWFVLG